MKGWETLDGGIWEVWQKAHFIPPTSFPLLSYATPRQRWLSRGSVWMRKEQWNLKNGLGGEMMEEVRKGRKKKKIGVLEAWTKLAFLSNLISQMAIAHLPDRDYETFLIVILAGNFESMIRPNLLMPSLSRSLQLWLPHVFHSSLMRVCPWTHSQG